MEKVYLKASNHKKKVRTATFLCWDKVGASKREYSKYLSVTPIRPKVRNLSTLKGEKNSSDPANDYNINNLPPSTR